MVLRPGVEFKPVECDPLAADGDLGEQRADLGVETVPVHPEVKGRIAQPDEPGEQEVSAGRREIHAVVRHASVARPARLKRGPAGLERPAYACRPYPRPVEPPEPVLALPEA